MKQLLKDIIRKSHIAYLRTNATRCCSLENQGKVLIVAPHPDDEVIGCGGLIARLVSEGRAPQIVVMTGGEGSHRSCCNLTDKELKAARRKLTRTSLAILGVPMENIHELNYPDGGISAENEQTEELKKLFERLQPQTVFVPHWGEGWLDHIKTAEIVKNLMSKDTEVYEYCVWMWYYNIWRGINWEDACKIDMTPKEYNLKLRAMDAYIKPLAPCRHPWSGVLPKVFLKANQWNKELYFKAK